jgi:hypothetical protein
LCHSKSHDELAQSGRFILLECLYHALGRPLSLRSPISLPAMRRPWNGSIVPCPKPVDSAAAICADARRCFGGPWGGRSGGARKGSSAIGDTSLAKPGRNAAAIGLTPRRQTAGPPCAAAGIRARRGSARWRGRAQKDFTPARYKLGSHQQVLLVTSKAVAWRRC